MGDFATDRSRTLTRVTSSHPLFHSVFSTHPPQLANYSPNNPNHIVRVTLRLLVCASPSSAFICLTLPPFKVHNFVTLTPLIRSSPRVRPLRFSSELYVIVHQLDETPFPQSRKNIPQDTSSLNFAALQVSPQLPFLLQDSYSFAHFSVGSFSQRNRLQFGCTRVVFSLSVVRVSFFSFQSKDAVQFSVGT